MVPREVRKSCAELVQVGDVGSIYLALFSVRVSPPDLVPLQTYQHQRPGSLAKRHLAAEVLARSASWRALLAKWSIPRTVSKTGSRKPSRRSERKTSLGHVTRRMRSRLAVSSTSCFSQRRCMQYKQATCTKTPYSAVLCQMQQVIRILLDRPFARLVEGFPFSSTGITPLRT